jgi:toxin-antitoxin system PIN domain toxin
VTKRPGAGFAPAAPRRAPLAREAASVWPLDGDGDLPDINVWLALAVQEHPHHAAARAYWDGTGGAARAPLWFCRVTMLGLVRLLCQPKVVGKGALTLAAAWTLYQRFRAVRGVGLLAEPGNCDTHLEALVGQGALPPRLWTDAYLCALALGSGLRLVTFDADFQRFDLPRCLVLTTP